MAKNKVGELSAAKVATLTALGITPAKRGRSAKSRNAATLAAVENIGTLVGDAKLRILVPSECTAAMLAHYFTPPKDATDKQKAAAKAAKDAVRKVKVGDKSPSVDSIKRWATEWAANNGATVTRTGLLVVITR